MAEDRTELASRVKMQGTMLCFPLEKPPGGVLERFGFGLEQPVLVRFSDERLEIRPLNTPAAVREKLKRAAVDLRGFTDRMRGYLEELPRLSEEELKRDEVEESELIGMLECLISDDLQAAIRKLESVDELVPTSGAVPPATDDDIGG
jgi:hypothetical protein